MSDGSMMTNDLKDILRYNTEESGVEFTDQSIMKYVKNNPQENMGFIDTIGFFKE
jgi:hypothetical protein